VAATGTDGAAATEDGTTRVAKEVGAGVAAEDAPGAKTPPGLEADGVAAALVAAGADAPPVALPVGSALPALPRVPAPAPILVIEAQLPIRELPKLGEPAVTLWTESPGLG